MSQEEVIQAMERLEAQYGYVFLPYAEIQKEVHKASGNVQSTMITALIAKKEIEKCCGLWIYESGRVYQNQVMYRRIKTT